MATYTVKKGDSLWKIAMDIGSIIRARYTIAGETPSFTFSLGAVVK